MKPDTVDRLSEWVEQFFERLGDWVAKSPRWAAVLVKALCLSAFVAAQAILGTWEVVNFSSGEIVQRWRNVKEANANARKGLRRDR